TIGASVMLSELVVGRKTQKNAIGAFHSLNPRWTFVGVIGIITGFIVLSYYSVIGGWVFKYVLVYLGGANMAGGASAFFKDFVSNPIQPIIFNLLFMGATVLIVMRGVSGGIEKANKVLMPGLFVLLLILLGRSLTIPGAMRGITFLTTLDFAALGPDGLLAALGQALFSLSIGLGTTCTYASYLSKRENLAKNTATICLLDTMIAFVAAFIIIPAVFATGTPLGEGGSFAFTALPGVFDALPGGTFFGALFYILLAFAALTSSISILEAIVAYAVETFHISRKRAAITAALLMSAVGSVYALSQGALPLHGVWYTLREGLHFPILGDMMEKLTDYILIPLGSLGFCIFVGWVWGIKNAKDEITQNGLFKFRLARVWGVFVKYVAPIAIIVIIVLGMMGEIKL
ncbi:MAG: sodium-dependent transporter, partial [Clostridia bacterium]